MNPDRTVHRTTGDTVERSTAQPVGRATVDGADCLARGCSFCCRRKLLIVEPREASRFPSHALKRKLIPANPRDPLSRRVQVFVLRLDHHGDCIFLHEGRCSIYAKRPAICRVFEPGSEQCANVIAEWHRLEALERQRAERAGRRTASAGVLPERAGR